MRLAGIDNIESANAFLPGYLTWHNERFGVIPADAQDAHAPCPVGTETLRRICALQHHRKLSKDLVVSFKRQRYIVQTGGAPRYALHGQTVTVVEYPDRRIELMHAQESLPFEVFDEAQPVNHAVDDKTLNPRVDEALEQRRHRMQPKPPSSHPWRKSYKQDSALIAHP